MSYYENELEQSYDRLEDQYWELIDYLKQHAPATLNAFKQRERIETSTELSNENIKAYAKSLGYDFDDESCEALRAESYKGETIEEAVNDYLNAYER